MGQRIYILSIILLLSMSSISQTIITDRPDQTESSSTIEAGSIQIETGVLLEETGSSSKKSLYAPSTLFRIGLTNKIEFRIINQFEHEIYMGSAIAFTNVISGVNDLELGAKFQLLKKDEISTEIAFLSHIVIPTASQMFGNEKIGIINKLCVSHISNSSVDVGYNFGYNYFGNNLGDVTYSLVLGFEIVDKINVYLEPYGEIIEFEECVSNINMGITYLLKDNIQLDYSFGMGINHPFNFVSIGCSIKIS